VAGVDAALKAGQIGFSGTALTRQSRAILDQIAVALQECPESTVEVAGYTDSSGSEAANQRTSQQRAQTAVDYLVGKGVDRARLTAVGYGQAEPISDNTTPEGRALNRRLEFKIKL
jgi:OOP family OmpA-OmpF porin